MWVVCNLDGEIPEAITWAVPLRPPRGILGRILGGIPGDLGISPEGNSGIGINPEGFPGIILRENTAETLKKLQKHILERTNYEGSPGIIRVVVTERISRKIFEDALEERLELCVNSIAWRPLRSFAVLKWTSTLMISAASVRIYKISKLVHLASALLITTVSNMSSFWRLTALFIFIILVFKFSFPPRRNVLICFSNSSLRFTPCTQAFTFLSLVWQLFSKLLII